jgi:hypothetical protein
MFRSRQAASPTTPQERRIDRLHSVPVGQGLTGQQHLVREEDKANSGAPGRGLRARTSGPSAGLGSLFQGSHEWRVGNLGDPILLAKIHTAQQLLEAGVRTQVVEPWVHFNVGNIRRALLIRPFQPS